MTSTGMERFAGERTAKILILIAVLFMLLIGYTSYVTSRHAAEVPLKRCRQCTLGCPCPSLSGSIRCGCPQ